MQKKWLLLVNPQAGGGKAKKILPQLRKALQDENIEFEECIPETFLEFWKKLSRAQNYCGIAIAGGDSALTLAAEKLIPKKIPLAFFGVGSQNDIARELGLINFAQVAKMMKTPPLRCDYLEVKTPKQHGIALGQVNFGLGVWVNTFVESFKKKHPYFYKFQFFLGLFAIIYAALGKKNVLDMEIHGEEHLHGRFHIALFSKIRHWAGGFFFVPPASINDGYIHLILVRDCSLWRLIYIILLSKRGQHLSQKEVIYIKSRQFSVRLLHPQSLQRDGEIWPLPDNHYTISCKQGGYLIHGKANS
ncbi:MAG: hypothetical protein NZM25_10420 [Leptospiraceae bacterium]|nr:hypothetical protein [Leptospiraceae bacterium]MDW8305841.1 diacylglycerol kinase family protein [Leptospiraceae bacterium]